ncbi:MAG TPA: hypothetical protein VFZ53_00355 [Polyangiaceae bacterium]
MPRNVNHESGAGKPESSAPRISVQYFRGDTLVCELRSAGSTVSVHISRGDGEGNRDNGWRVEAHGKVVDEEIVITAAAPTRRSALMEVGSKWSVQGAELGLQRVDWDAVAVALVSVSAID